MKGKKGAVTWTPEQYGRWLAKAQNGRGAVPEKSAGAVKIKRRRRRVMNKTEAAFGRLLEARRQRGEIVSYEFEGITLRWGNEESFAYTPDYFVIESIVANGNNHVRVCCMEVKGSQIWKDDASRFKHARDNFPLFEFSMWQCRRGEWRQIR